SAVFFCVCCLPLVHTYQLQCTYLHSFPTRRSSDLGEPPLRSCQQHQGTTDPPYSLTPPSWRALHGTPRRRPWTSTLTPGRGANDLMNNEPVRLSDPRFTTDLAAFQRWMHHEYGPVVPVLLEENIPAWLVIGYQELHHVLSTPSLFARSSTRWNGWGRLPPESPLQTVLAPMPNLLSAEGEDHRLRSLATDRALDAIPLHELRSVITRFADRLIDGFCG